MKLQITCHPNCGNAPKKEFLRSFNVAFAEGNVDYLLDHVTDTVQWTVIGDRVVEGKPAFRAALEEMKGTPATALLIEKILTHGREGAVTGALTMRDGTTFFFADVYEFSGAKGEKIRAFTSYVVEGPSPPTS